MRPLRSSSLLSSTPILRYSACSYTPSHLQRSLRPQTSSPTILWGYPPGPAKRFFSVSTSLQSSPDPTFSYQIGASFSAKDRRFNPKEDSFNLKSDLPVTSGKEFYTGRPKSGQDAFFISGAANGNNVAFGVTDGVGGWSGSGIDSAHFSHSLCQWMARIVKEAPYSEKRYLPPQTLLQNAYNRIVKDGKIEGGGSTACIAVGSQDGTLQVANLGDSGFIQLRLNAVHHFSNPQTHAFNTPYQLSVVPPKILALTRLLGGKRLSDSPADSNDTSHQVRHGDILIFATDGVWDNLSQLELLKIVSRQMTGFNAWVTGDNGTEVSDNLYDLTQEGGIPKQHKNTLQTLLAVNIVSEAKAASINTRRDGPFAKEVQRHYPDENYHGGKVDDICVVVAIVVKNEKDKS